MIKFFRNTRQKLINSGKVSKYLTYAIGEILLVVVGILIALQINNWSESRKEEKKTQTYIQNIIADMEEDIDNIESLIEEGKTQLKFSAAFRTYYNTGNHNLELLLDSALQSTRGFYRYFPINQTFLDMQSSGHTGLLNPQQRKILIELVTIQQQLSVFIGDITSLAIGELSARNKFINWENNFYETLGHEPSDDVLRSALLHQLNYMHELNELAEVMEYYGTDIIEKSYEAIKLFN